MRFVYKCALIALGIGINAEPLYAQTPTYVVSLGNVTVFDGVAHVNDTDYFSLVVDGPNGQHFEKTYGAYHLKKNDQPDLKLSSPPISVPNDQHAQLKITWAAVNNGTGDAQKIASGLSQAATTIGQGVPNPIVAIASTLAQPAFQVAFANCDTPLFGGTAIFDGAALASGQGLWPAEGPNKWHQVYDYSAQTNPPIPVPGGCDSGVHYNIEVHITRQ